MPHGVLAAHFHLFITCRSATICGEALISSRA